MPKKKNDPYNIDERLDKILKSLQSLTGFVHNDSIILEEYFLNYFKEQFLEYGYVKVNGYYFYSILNNGSYGKKKKRREFDIILANPEQKILLAIEIKRKLHPDFIKEYPKYVSFLKADPMFNGYKILLGFATTVVSEDIKKEILNNGMFFFEKAKTVKISYNKDKLHIY